MSGFVPSIAALIQGVGGNPECRNVTTVSPDGNINSTVELYTPGINLIKFIQHLFFWFIKTSLIYKPYISNDVVHRFHWS